MDSIFNFSQLFSETKTQTQAQDRCDQKTVYTAVPAAPVYTAVPAAPVYEEVPDFDFFLTAADNSQSANKHGTVNTGLLSQTLKKGTSARKPPLFGKKKKPEAVTFESIRDDDNDDDDGDSVYLGSQFPVVHRVRASQAERIQKRRNLEVFVNPSPAAPTIQPYKQATQVSAPSTKRSKTGHFAARDVNVAGSDVTFRTPAQVQPTLPEQTSAKQDVLKPPAAIVLPTSGRGGFKLRSVQEISELHRKIFNFPYFNIVQSKVFDDVMYTDRPLVLCSPTGSGKTAVFEMAIVRLLQLQTLAGAPSCNMKVVYVAPIKALCSEKFTDWKAKFEPYNLKVAELTGDTDTEDFFQLQDVNIILTTPEKWDSMTRKWRDNRAVMEAICLFLVDEIHVLNDATRGATVEAVLSRMKTIQAARGRSKTAGQPGQGPGPNTQGLRFIAVSATITNIEDLAEWLGSSKDNPALYYKFDDSVRPVRLRKVVMGFYFAEGKQSEFQFDINLNYKLTGIINTYCENKPTLVFCATRKSAIQGAEVLARDGRQAYLRGGQHRHALQNLSFNIKDTKLRDLVAQGIGYHHAGMDLQDRNNPVFYHICKQNLVAHGIGYHHAGMDLQDRKTIEQIFANGELPVLVATSTLAMGVNLPAHLVIIKSTMYYHMGVHQEYSDTQVLQMIGRAGRPQFDSSATAVIMTKNQTKMKYENLLNGTQLLESSLHRNLIEHLNAEIVLGTISDMSVALEWLKYTFLYIRVMKNPRQYGLQTGMTRNQIEKKLQEMCMQCLNQLNGLNLIHMDLETMDVKPTENGRLMARYCISYRTAELFHSISGTETVAELLTVLSKCEEFEDIILRNNEKKSLNTLNRDKNRLTIRYPMTGKIKTTEMKVNCLVQAQFGCLLVQDFALQQDTSRIFRAGMRITRCLVEFLSQKSDYRSLLSALLLCKCCKARIWEDSKYVSRQLEGIGPTLSTAMVNAGLITFEKIEQTNPREIELIVNRHPPFGNQVRNSVAKLPKYEIVIEQSSKYSMSTAEIVVTVQLANKGELQETINNNMHMCTLMVGDEDNRVIYKQRIMDKLLLKETTWCKRLEIRLANKGPELHVHYISQDLVGLDVECTYNPIYLGGKRITSSSVAPQIPMLAPMEIPSTVSEVGRPCNHNCHNKALCAHECCKTGVSSRRRQAKTPQTLALGPSRTPALGPARDHMGTPAVGGAKRQGATRSVANHLSDLKKRMVGMPDTPSLGKRVRINPNEQPVIDLTRFAYTTNKPHQAPLDHHNPITPDCEMTAYEGPPNVVSAPRRSVQQRHLVIKPTRQNWPELDMFQKSREKYQAEFSRSYVEEEDSLPDIDEETERRQESHNYTREAAPSWQTAYSENVPQQQQHWEDDFGHETDYGYTYIQGQDQEQIPADWDDKLVANDHLAHKRAGAAADTNIGDPGAKSRPYQSVRGSFKRPPIPHVYDKPSLPSHQRTLPSHQNQLYSSNKPDDYEIQDFSDEENNRVEVMDVNNRNHFVTKNMQVRNQNFPIIGKRYFDQLNAQKAVQNKKNMVGSDSITLNSEQRRQLQYSPIDATNVTNQQTHQLAPYTGSNMVESDSSTVNSKQRQQLQMDGSNSANNVTNQQVHPLAPSYTDDLVFDNDEAATSFSHDTTWQANRNCYTNRKRDSHRSLQDNAEATRVTHPGETRVTNPGEASVTIPGDRVETAIQDTENLSRAEVSAGAAGDGDGAGDSSKWDSYCNTQETSVSDCLNWQYPTQVGTEVVMGNRGDNPTMKGDNSAVRRAQNGAVGGGLSVGCHGDATNTAGHVQQRLGAVGNLQQPLSEQGHKYGQVLSWVSDTENQLGASSSPEWEPWGSQEELLAGTVEPAPGSNLGQKPARPGGAPLAEVGHTAKAAELTKKKQRFTSFFSKEKRLKLLTRLNELRKAAELTKKPRFTSFFSKEKMDAAPAPAEGFYNIFEGIF